MYKSGGTARRNIGPADQGLPTRPWANKHVLCRVQDCDCAVLIYPLNSRSAAQVKEKARERIDYSSDDGSDKGMIRPIAPLN